MASSLVLFVFGHGVETSHLGDVSAQELCQASEDFSLELPPAHMTVMRGLLATFTQKKSDSFESPLSSEIHEYRPLSSCHALPPDRRETRRWNADSQH